MDAHADINNPQRSVSGNMHGMPVSFLMGLVDQPKKLPGFEWFQPTVDVKDVVYIGLRDLDEDEKITIRKHGIKAYSVYMLSFFTIFFRNFYLRVLKLKL